MSFLTVCIFSFNRGKYLYNCIKSIQHCIPQANIVVFDDHSDDPDTIKCLNNIKDTCTVIKPNKEGTIKHGGLYHNMNHALELLKNSPLICFLQDDTQLVRPVKEDELNDINTLFIENPTLGFVHPCFIRGIDLKKHSITPLPGPTGHTFYRQPTGQSAGIHYSDLVIFKPDRLIAAGWHFQQSEPANDQQAQQLFGMMAYLWLPLAMWLPEVPAYRGKKKTLGLRLAEQKKQVGFYPFKLLHQSDVDNFAQRDKPTLPIAEECLTCEPFTPPSPWTYNPLTGLNVYKQMNNIEVALRRWLGR
jgi:hypothetical protein|tara:strand:- start:304 stop:1212 length:909 start_codon:yes stop_codon:yes gene_type:complete